MTLMLDQVKSRVRGQQESVCDVPSGHRAVGPIR